ncbi:unnamed protein product [Amoebophrya sp. A25]|nr:unnamed protein product [Amoebophrya sp. A25]|eukprot:GSA25T00011491001.1
MMMLSTGGSSSSSSRDYFPCQDRKSSCTLRMLDSSCSLRSEDEEQLLPRWHHSTAGAALAASGAGREVHNLLIDTAAASGSGGNNRITSRRIRGPNDSPSNASDKSTDYKYSANQVSSCGCQKGGDKFLSGPDIEDPELLGGSDSEDEEAAVDRWITLRRERRDCLKRCGCHVLNVLLLLIVLLCIAIGMLGFVNRDQTPLQNARASSAAREGLVAATAS